MKSDFLAIDELRLEAECISQPTTYFEYSMKLANARRTLDEAKSNLDVVDAELKKRIRVNPKRFGIEGEKVTEAAINSTVPLQAEYKEAQEILVDAKYESDIAQAAVTALDQRKRMIEVLVTLRGQELYSTPRVNGDAKLALDHESKRRIRTLGQRKPMLDDEPVIGE